MEYVNLGTTGLKVTRICLGTMTYGSPKWRDWVIDYDASKPFIQRAWELGINFFDSADKPVRFTVQRIFAASPGKRSSSP